MKFKSYTLTQTLWGLLSVFFALNSVSNANANSLMESVEAIVKVDPSLKSADKNL